MCAGLDLEPKQNAAKRHIEVPPPASGIRPSRPSPTSSVSEHSSSTTASRCGPLKHFSPPLKCITPCSTSGVSAAASQPPADQVPRDVVRRDPCFSICLARSNGHTSYVYLACSSLKHCPFSERNAPSGPKSMPSSALDAAWSRSRLAMRESELKVAAPKQAKGHQTSPTRMTEKRATTLPMFKSQIEPNVKKCKIGNCTDPTARNQVPCVLSMAQLKPMLKAQGLDTGGSKNDWLARLAAASPLEFGKYFD